MLKYSKITVWNACQCDDFGSIVWGLQAQDVFIGMMKGDWMKTHTIFLRASGRYENPEGGGGTSSKAIGRAENPGGQ